MKEENGRVVGDEGSRQASSVANNAAAAKHQRSPVRERMVHRARCGKIAQKGRRYREPKGELAEDLSE